MSERIKFEEWLKGVHLLEATWNEDRNCYNEYPAHLAYKSWLASRSVPDVPELVRCRLKLHGSGYTDKYVLHSQAAEIIAANDGRITDYKNLVDALHAKLTQYEEQEPIGELCRMSNKWNVMEIDATFYDDDMHIKDGMKIYTSPAPAADLKSENERLREALEWYANPEIYKPHPHGSAFDSRDLSFKAKSTIAALKVEYSHDPH